MDERGCMQSVVRISTAQWCVYGITLDAECLSYWVGDVRGTPDNATLFEKRVIDTAQHKSVANSYDGANSETATDDDDGAAANSEPVIDEPANEDVAANSPPIANAVPTADDGPAKLRLDGDDIVWSVEESQVFIGASAADHAAADTVLGRPYLVRAEAGMCCDRRQVLTHATRFAQMRGALRANKNNE